MPGAITEKRGAPLFLHLPAPRPAPTLACPSGSRIEAGARFEQELARLFWRSGWTQEELAKKEGKSQTHVAKLLRFGRFLDFSSSGTVSQNPAFSKLTERRFRDYWSPLSNTAAKRT